MLMKRVYVPEDLKRYQAEVETNGGKSDGIVRPKVSYISLAHTGVSAEQHFSTRLVTEGLETGVMEIKNDNLILHVAPEDLKYKIKRYPGRYCLHCGKKLTDDASGKAARLHVAVEHEGKSGVGYEAINFYDCVLDAAQHEKYRLRDPARAPKFHSRKEK